MLEIQNSNSSLPELLSKLCRNFNKTSKKLNVKKLKSRLYSILLHFSKPTYNMTRSTSGLNLNEIDMIYAELHCMINMRKFDQACELQQFLDQLKDENGQISDEILSCLKFFIYLARWQESPNSIPLGGPWHIPRLSLNSTMSSSFSSKQLTVYGDTRAYKPSFYYTQYPNDIFESVSQLQILDTDSFNNNVFEAPPGYDECGNSLYKCLNSKPQSWCETPGNFTSLGPANKNCSLNDITLQIPVLTNYFAQNPMSFTLRSSQSSGLTDDQCSYDEGFIDTDNNNKVVSCPDPGEIWETVSKLQPLPRKSWDNKNKLVGSKAPLYPCQSGPVVGQVAYFNVMKHLNLIDPQLSSQQEAPSSCTSGQTFEQLIQDVVNLLLGVPSRTFFFDKQKQQFRLRTKISVPTINSEPLSQVLKDFLDCGTVYLKLETFAQPHTLGSYITNGLVVECFKEGVSQYLQYYRGCILYAKETQSSTIFCLHQAIHKAYRQLRYLTDLCLGDRHLLSRVGQECVLPKGLKLLSYLFQSALQEWGGENDYLLLFLLKTACTPYFRFLHDWVFEGTLNDPYNEFNIRINENCLRNQSFRSLFWSQGYVLREKLSSVPFLGGTFTRSVLLCGKSLNLLRICDPKHPLLDSRHHRPTLSLSLSSQALEKTLQESSNYYDSLKCWLSVTDRQIREVPSTNSQDEKASLVPRNVSNLNTNVSNAETRSVDLETNPKALSSIEDACNANTVCETSEELETTSETTAMLEALEKEVELEIKQQYSQMIEMADNAKEKLLWRARRLALHEKRSELLKSERLVTEEKNILNICPSKNGNNNSIVNNNVGPFRNTTDAFVSTDATLILSDDAENGNLSDLMNTGQTANQLPCSENHLEVTESRSASVENEQANVDTVPVNQGTVSNFQGVKVVLQVSSEPLKEKTKTVKSEIHDNKDRLSSGDYDMECDVNSKYVLPVEDIKCDLEPDEHQQEDEKVEELDFDRILHVTVPKVQPYQTEYRNLLSGSLPLEDILVSLNVFSPNVDWEQEQIVDCLSIPLPVFFQRSLNPLLQAQVRLVNQAVLHHFKQNLQLTEHLNILRNLFFFNDGEFGRTLCHLIYIKASSLVKFRDLLNPFALNTILNTALSCCHTGDSPLAENLCLGPKLGCNTEPAPGFAVLMNLEMKYKVDWPVDIVISEESEQLYNMIFAFLLQINYVMLSLTDSWYRLKHYDQLFHLSGHWQFRHIQVFRHEMLHFAQSVYEFVCRQILQLSWEEFQTELNEKVEDLDELRNAHMSYLQKACRRCMLGSGADSSLPKCIGMAFQMCLYFHNQLIMLPWQKGMPLDEDAFSRLVRTYQFFKNHQKVLCKALKQSSFGRYNDGSSLVSLLDVLDYCG